MGDEIGDFDMSSVYSAMIGSLDVSSGSELPDELQLYIDAYRGKRAMNEIADRLEGEDLQNDPNAMDDRSKIALMILGDGFSNIGSVMGSDGNEDIPFEVSDGDDPMVY